MFYDIFDNILWITYSKYMQRGDSIWNVGLKRNLYLNQKQD